MILDSDLAATYGVETKRINEQVKRNESRFGPGYCFQLTKEEFDDWKSSDSETDTGRGGRRSLPWVFTEHGVVMAAAILDSDQAIEASKFVVEVFVEVRRRVTSGTAALVPTQLGGTSLERLSTFGHGMTERLQLALTHVLDSVIDTNRNSTVREEAQSLISESLKHIKDRLQKQGLENEEIAARVAKLIAEAEKEKAIAAKTRAEAEKLEFATIIKKLRLLLEVQRAVERDRLDDFLEVLKEMGDA